MNWEEKEEEFKLLKATKNSVKTIKTYEKAFRNSRVTGKRSILNSHYQILLNLK